MNRRTKYDYLHKSTINPSSNIYFGADFGETVILMHCLREGICLPVWMGCIYRLRVIVVRYFVSNLHNLTLQCNRLWLISDIHAHKNATGAGLRARPSAAQLCHQGDAHCNPPITERHSGLSSNQSEASTRWEVPERLRRGTLRLLRKGGLLGTNATRCASL